MHTQTQRKQEQRRAELSPVLADAFAELGYRRATTAELAARCDLRENELYRLWKSKKEMFICAIQGIYDSTIARWNDVLQKSRSKSAAETILDHQASNHGHAKFYRIVFSGLQESNDPEIKAVLKNLYRQFHAVIVDLVAEHRGVEKSQLTDDEFLEIQLTAWALIGVGAMTDIDLTLGLSSARKRKQLIQQMGNKLLASSCETQVSRVLAESG